MTRIKSDSIVIEVNPIILKGLYLNMEKRRLTLKQAEDFIKKKRSIKNI